MHSWHETQADEPALASARRTLSGCCVGGGVSKRRENWGLKTGQLDLLHENERDKRPATYCSAPRN